MLHLDDLKLALQRDGLSRADKVLLVIASIGQPVKNPAIMAQAQVAGCNMKTWNVADILSKAKGTTLRVPGGYELSEKGHARLTELGVSKLPPAAAKVAQDLRKHLASIKDETTRAFIIEAIQCHEAALYRSAIVMSWLAAIGVLHNEVVANHLIAFNAEAKKVDGKWKIAATTDDLGRMKESDFLDRIAAVGVIGKNVKAQLAAGLNLRNGCGHPNSLKVGANAVAAHIEMLLLNVFDKFAS
ncbi:hypothetical protein GGQ91_001069 [Methylobacterium fujisawaense]|uniref:Abortive infection protein-like C-terminal domain-containing protein n=1 Tax=Methylobacterium fujisawaense TaxID=107400 RepID=A0ABR6D7F5_9HYPH|nr:hypothetical protein [Methylobacterium fujisawaense]MBA9061692.1 hypothetical protein [Methylobacterium fujisawaense]